MMLPHEGMIGGTPAPINDRIDSVIMADGRTLFQIKPYIIFFPAIFLSLTVLAVNLMGDGFRDVLDPRKSKTS